MNLSGGPDKHVYHNAKPIRLDQKELDRADGEFTVVVRPQADGEILVAVVRIKGNEGHLMGKPYTNYVKTKEEVPAAVADVNRWLHKMGHPTEMGDASRHREATMEERVAARFLQGAATTRKLPSHGGSRETYWAVLVNGQEVGLVRKIRDTRTDFGPFNAYIGIGQTKFIGHFWDETAAKKRGLDPKKLVEGGQSHLGGFDAAVKAVEHAAPHPHTATSSAERVAQRFLAEVTRPTPMAGEQQPVAMALEDAPDEEGWSPYEKRGEWNLLIYHPGGRRNLSYFMKNPQGGGGGSNDGTSVKALVNMVIRSVGWASPHINPHRKDKVWVSVLQWDGKDWAPLKQWWQPVPPELLVPKTPQPMSTQEHFERLTR